MFILKIISRNRRDFYAVYKCEHCGHETGEQPGYDDANYHDNVIPEMECDDCGKSSGGVPFDPQAPRYEEGLQV
jgi:DNA-directed RNA polymerase subunit RPC12/RpoP